MRQFHLQPVCASVCAALALVAMSLPAQAQYFSPESFVDAEFKASRALELIRAQYAYSWGYTGQGVTIAIIDTGVDIDHPEFSGRVSPYLQNYIPGYGPTDMYTDLDVGDNDHGTHVAGLAAAGRNGFGMHGVAYNATVLPLRTTYDDDELDNAFARAIQGGAKVLNGSYGPRTFAPRFIPTNPDNPDGTYVNNVGYQKLAFQAVLPTLESSYYQVASAAMADIVMVFSAGNSRQFQPGEYTAIPSGNAMLPLITPANTTQANPLYRFLDIRKEIDPNDAGTFFYVDENDASDPGRQEIETWDFSYLKGALIASVATDPQGIIASYSNLCGATAAWCIAAPGGGNGQPVYATLPYGNYGPKQGTSMSAPVVSGAAAVLREAFPYMTARQIIEVILTTADSTTLTEWGDEAIYGRGMLDLGTAINGPILFGEPIGGSRFESIFSPNFEVNTQGYDSVWRNNISGTGGMAKAGAGTLTMTGQNSYQGATDITGGKLVVNGSIASSQLLTVGTDAALGGSGTVGDTVMYGRMAPGNSVGTLTVAGDYTQLPGSVFELELGADAIADQLVVNGQADIQGGMIEVRGLKASHLGRQFSFLEANSWGAQTFDNTNIDWAFVDMDAAFVGNRVSLSVQRNTTTFASVAQSRNQRAVAHAVESQGIRGSAYNDVVALEHAANAPRLFDILSGEIYASTQSALFDTGGILRQTALARMRQGEQQSGLVTLGSASGPTVQSAPSGRHSVWGQALGSWGHLGATGDAQQLDRSTGGMLFGGDTAVGTNTRVGLAVGFTDSTFRGTSSSRVKAEGYHLMAYIGSQQGHWALRGGVAQSWYDVDARRSLGYADWGTASSSAHSQSTQLFAEAGYGMDVGKFKLEPYAGVAQVWLRQAGFNENGSPVGLQAGSTSDAVTFTTLGLRTGLMLDQGKYGSLQATAGLGWRHAFGDVDASRSLRFATGSAYSVVGTPLAKNAMVAELGVDWVASAASRVNISYVGQIAGGTQDHGVQARASWAF
ncbi:autotransporter domain-containing protein [Alcaligenaceae bacterium]|nr:autotransporter domain-containing protein [Alcaligenaceae bacterium]